MDYKNIIIIACYAALSLLNFAISAKVFKTMLEYAGVTQNEMTQFMSQQHFPSTSGKSSMHRSSIQKRKRAAMLNFLLEHTQNTDEIKELFTLYERTSLPIGISMLLLMIGLMLKRPIIIFIGVGAYLIGNIVVLSLLASFKKRNPLTSAEIETLDAKRSDENGKRFMPARVFVIVMSIIPIVAMVFVLGNVGKAVGIGYGPQKPPSYAMTTTPHSPDKFGLSTFLDERGFWTED